MPNERANRSREKQIGRAAGERASERASDANGGRTGRSFCSARPRSARDSRACQSAAELRAPSPQLSKRSAGASVACETMPVASLSIVWPRLDLPRCSRRRRRSNCNSCCRHARRPLEPIGRPFCCNFSMNLLAGRPAGRPAERAGSSSAANNGPRVSFVWLARSLARLRLASRARSHFAAH